MDLAFNLQRLICHKTQRKKEINIKSQMLFSLFELISMIQSFGLSWFVLRFPTLPAPIPSLWGAFQVCLLHLVSPSLLSLIIFSLSCQSLCICFLFCFLWFSLCEPSGWQSLLFGRLSFFFLFYDYVWSSGQDLVICLYSKSQESFIHLILLDGVKFMHIPFGSMVKF